VNVEGAPGLLRQMYAEGHEIGNHTYWHPNTASVSRERIRFELNATQRIVQDALGLSTTLFRPPYNVDSAPQTPEEIEPILLAQQLGYLSVSAGIDPQDWQAGITADAIVAETIRREADGRVVLLHDGGGDRSATVAALPRIIGYFRSRGYRFVTIGELIGRPRGEVMPPIADGEGLWAGIAGGTFAIKSWTTRVLEALWLTTIGLALLRAVAFGGLAVCQKAQAQKRVFEERLRPPVSVIVAAYNEERLIVRTVESVLSNGYPDLEVVIVNDGSTDRTAAVLEHAFGDDARVRIHTHVRGGKAAALNTALTLARHELLIAIDADTVLRPGTIERLVRHFADPSVGAVSGNVRVGNQRNWITRFQSIEYVFGFNLDRRALEILNAITVVPGAAGAWRKRVLQKLGGFSAETLAEDTDLTLAILRAGYRIRYDEEAVAHTEAPEDVRGLARQRFRWSFGTLQAAWKHRDATFRLRYGSLGFVALPSIWLCQLGLALLAPVADAALLIALVAGSWRTVIVYYLGFITVELVTGLIAYALEGKRPLELALLPAQRLYYRLFMHYVLGKAILAAVEGRLVSWAKLERHGGAPADRRPHSRAERRFIRGVA
jgi:cellulose synthase/poly-beta-1,6-N-acetylglucosamine synthase-like glycosyltransferase